MTDDLSAVPERAGGVALDALRVRIEADAKERISIRRERAKTIEVTQAAQS